MSNLNKHIWEGWTAQDFIDALNPQFETIQSNASNWGLQYFESKDALKQWCKDNQPYYKKHIPEVFNYFKTKANLK